MRSFLIWLLLLLPALAQDFDPERLKRGSYTLYLRHASAELGKDAKQSTKAHWWTSSNPKLTRQLDPKGLEQARTLGQALKHLRIHRILCSEFRRAQDTAQGLKLGPVETTDKLTPLIYPGAFADRLQSLLERPMPPNSVTILVAHGHVTPLFANLSEGDIAVYSAGPGARFLGFVPFDAWRQSWFYQL